MTMHDMGYSNIILFIKFICIATLTDFRLIKIYVITWSNMIIVEPDGTRMIWEYYQNSDIIVNASVRGSEIISIL